MAVNRREFVKRLAAFALLAGAGAVGLWETVARQFGPQEQTPTLPVLNASTSSDAVTTASSSSTVITSSSTGTSASASSTQARSSQTASSSSGTTTSTAQTVPSGYVLVAPVSALGGKTSAYFNHPTFGLSILLHSGGQWRAFNAACTHAGCTVQFTGSSIYCPCHSGYFSPVDGSVQSGPPPSPLPEYAVLVQNGQLFVGLTTIN